VNEPAGLPIQISHGNDGAAVLTGRLMAGFVFTSQKRVRIPEIWIMNADGAGSRQLTADTYFKTGATGFT